MRQTSEKRKAAWRADARQAGYRRRNWPMIRWLGGLAAFLLLAGLLTELFLGSRTLAIACWIGAAVATMTLLCWFFDRRLFVQRPPSPPQ